MEYKINVTQQDLQVLFMGLGELPVKIAVNLLGKLQSQVAEQDSKSAVSIEDLGLSEIQPPVGM